MAGILFFLWDVARGLGLLSVFLFCAFGWGAFILHILGYRERFSIEFYVCALALGMGVLAHLTLALGALRLLYPASAVSLLGLSALVTIFELWRRRDPYLTAWRIVGEKFRRQWSRPGWFGFALVILIGLGWSYPLLSAAFTPPLSYDEIAYHLPIAKIYAQSHTLQYIDFIPYSNWPLETELLFTLSLLLRSESLAHLVTWGAFVLVCAGLYAAGRRRFGYPAGLLAAAIFAGTPVVTTLAGTALIELPLTLYTFLGILFFLEWVETGCNDRWILSAVFGGLAASTKLNAAVTPLILGLLLAGVALVLRRETITRAAKRFSLYGLVAFAVVAPWFLKTWIQTGNPFWPFLYPILGGRNWDALGSEYLFGFIHSPNMALTPANWLLGLWQLTAHPLEFGSYRFDLGWAYLLILPVGILALFLQLGKARREGRQAFLLSTGLVGPGWLAVLSLVFYTAWFFQTHQTRFLMPVMPLFALFLAGSGVMVLRKIESRPQGYWLKASLQLGLVAILIAGAWPVKPRDRAGIAANWPFLSGQMTRRQFLDQNLPGYEAFVYANKNLPQKAGVWLALYESRGYYLDRFYKWANPISQRSLHLETMENAGELAAELQRQGLNYVLLQTDTLDKYTYIPYGTWQTQLVRDLVAQYGKLLASAPPLELYQLTP